MTKKIYKIILFISLLVILIITYSISSFLLFISSHNKNDLKNEIKYACNINLFPSDEFIYQRNTTLGYMYGIVFEYYRTFSKDNKDYKIIYYDYKFNFINIPYMEYPYARIEMNDKETKFSAYIYKNYYKISASGYTDNGFGRTWLYINYDYSYNLNDEIYYNDILKYISEIDIKNTIQIFYNESNNDMKKIYNTIN